MYVCVKCRRKMCCKKNSVGARFGTSHVYPGDKFECPECKVEILATNKQPVFLPSPTDSEEFVEMKVEMKEEETFETSKSLVWLKNLPIDEQVILSTPFNEGYLAGKSGKSELECPYKSLAFDRESRAWEAGYRAGGGKWLGLVEEEETDR